MVVHGRFTRLLVGVTSDGKSPRSFAAKYLHFHNHAVPKALTKTTSVTLRIFKNGRPQKKLVLGSRAANATLTYRWVCRLPKGTFTRRVYAIDTNHRAQTAAGSNKLIVK